MDDNLPQLLGCAQSDTEILELKPESDGPGLSLAPHPGGLGLSTMV
jgi:hypothetical protein